MRTLVKLYTGSATPDYISVCTCLMFLDDHVAVANILDQLISGSADDTLLAYQIGFDLCENEIQKFLMQVRRVSTAIVTLSIAFIT
jgi:26S proteasome regulatory subunit N2